MGGSAIQFNGTYTQSPRGDGVTEGAWGVDVQPPQAAKDFQDMFRDYVRSFGQPWNATKEILDYIGYAASLGWRTEPRGSDLAPWNGYLRLSGCSGMAEVSAGVACHWIHLWLVERPSELASILAGFGFEITAVHHQQETCTYFPTTTAGYAAYWADANCPGPSDDPWSGQFYLDAGAYDHLEDGGRTLAQELHSQAGQLMSDGKCHCQLCDPMFSPTISCV